MAVVVERIRFSAPDAKTGALIEALRIRRRGTDAEADDGDAGKGSGVLDGGSEEFGADALSAVRWEDVHAPEINFVSRFDVAVAEEA